MTLNYHLNRSYLPFLLYHLFPKFHHYRLCPQYLQCHYFLMNRLNLKNLQCPLFHLFPMYHLNLQFP
jgi:hypothetical protein